METTIARISRIDDIYYSSILSNWRQLL